MTSYPAFPVDTSVVIKPTCYLAFCKTEPAPGPTGLCRDHLARARATRMVMAGGIELGGCLAGCPGTCAKGRWKTNGAWKEFTASSECEHLPPHMLRLAAKSARRAA